jgi:hypothetical protein
MKKFRIRHNKDFHSIVAHVHKYLICGTFYANPIDKLYNYTKMLSLKLTIHECKYFFMNFLRNLCSVHVLVLCLNVKVNPENLLIGGVMGKTIYGRFKFH